MASNSGKTIKTTDLRGLFIYQEKKRTVYYDIFNKSGYILNNAEIKNYLMYSGRYSGMALVGCLLYYMTGNVPLAVGVAVAGLIILEIVFRKAFLHKLPEIRNYERPEKQKYVDYVAENESLTRMGLILLATVLLVAVLIYNIMTGVYKDQLSVIISYLVIAGAAVFFVLNVIAVFKKLKMEKK